MSSICLDKIKTYTNEDNSNNFIKVSLTLFSKELNSFLSSIENFLSVKDEKLFKQAIHKIKPNFELFIDKKEVLDKLLFLYSLNFETYKQLDPLVYDIYYFVKRLISDTEDLISVYSSNR